MSYETSGIDQSLAAAHARIDELEARLKAIRAVVDEQAEDEGLWGTHIPPSRQPIVEAYLQQALRRLHHVVEGT